MAAYLLNGTRYGFRCLGEKIMLRLRQFSPAKQARHPPQTKGFWPASGN